MHCKLLTSAFLAIMAIASPIPDGTAAPASALEEPARHIPSWGRREGTQSNETPVLEGALEQPARHMPSWGRREGTQSNETPVLEGALEELMRHNPSWGRREGTQSSEAPVLEGALEQPARHIPSWGRREPINAASEEKPAADLEARQPQFKVPWKKGSVEETVTLENRAPQTFRVWWKNSKDGNTKGSGDEGNSVEARGPQFRVPWKKGSHTDE